MTTALSRRSFVRDYFTFWWPLLYYRRFFCCCSLFVFFIFHLGWNRVRAECITTQKSKFFFFIMFRLVCYYVFRSFDRSFGSVRLIRFYFNAPVIKKTSHRIRWLCCLPSGSLFRICALARSLHTSIIQCLPLSHFILLSISARSTYLFICLYLLYYQFFNFMCNEHAIDANEKLL